MPARDQISLGILAGGRATRLGGADKALLQFRGSDLLARTLASAGSGFSAAMLSYNGSDPRARRPGLPWVADLRPNHPGPLAGLESLLTSTRSSWLLTLPVDLRNCSPELVDRLCQAGSSGAVIRDADGLQPLVALWHVPSARLAVSAALAAGERAVHPLLAPLAMDELDISPLRLGNLNSPDDFE